MYNFLVSNPIFTIIFVMVVVVLAIFLLVKVMQKVGMEKVRKVVYDGFTNAEDAFEHGDNEQKLEYVVQLARSSIPAPFNIFITENSCRKVIELWFKVCKSLLDYKKPDENQENNEQ